MLGTPHHEQPDRLGLTGKPFENSMGMNTVKGRDNLRIKRRRLAHALTMRMQLYGHGETAPHAEEIDRSGLWTELGKADGRLMKRITNSPRVPTDDVYYVSAADVADKLIDRMRRGSDPLLLSSGSWDLLPTGPMVRTHAHKEFD
jgi:hypothetical protein